MKRMVCILLALLLLTGCAGIPGKDSRETQEILMQRRNAAEQKMREMMTVFWQVDQELTYSYKVGSGDPTSDAKKYVTTLEPGKIYSGLPYTHGVGDELSFADFGEKLENGVLRMNRLTPQLLNGSGGMKKENNIARLGNDCADAVFAAWTTVSSSVTFQNAANMTPKNGCIPVGDYKTVSEDAGDYGITKDICVENGEETMFAAYALLQKADGLSVNTKGGAHAMLVSEVNVVEKDGKIDPEESYVLVHEQAGSFIKAQETRYEEALGQDVYVMGGVDRKYTFQRLFKAGYLPVTCKEFIDPAPLAVETVTDSEAGLPMDKNTMFDGAFVSNYRIVAVTLEILDGQGGVVQTATCYSGGGDRNIFLLSRFQNELEQSVMSGEQALYKLEAGTYTCRFTCRLSTGLEQVAREFTFQK